MSFLINNAHADTTAPAATGSATTSSTAPSSTGSSSTGSNTTTTATTGSSGSTTEAKSKPAIGIEILMLLGFVAIFYFLIWRPQAKRNKEHKAMLGSIHDGSEVVFAGGLIGRVKKMDGDYVVIELAPHNEVKVQKGAIQAVLPEGTINNI